MIDVEVKKRLGSFLLEAKLKDEGFICLAGPNGSGKTSLLSVIAGVTTADEGHVLVGSRDVSLTPIEKRDVVLVSPDSYIPHLSVDAHLTWGARLKGLRVDSEYLDHVKTFLGISSAGSIRQLSLGMRERVSLATALISKPQVILVDEAFLNLDNREEFIEEYHRLARDARVDVLYTTPTSEMNGSHADHVYKMEMGRTTRVL